MSAIPSTSARVPAHSPPAANERIGRFTEASVLLAAREGPEGIRRRLAELDREWDIERAIEANASSLVLVFTLLGAFASRWFLVVPALVGAFLLQHAVQGWCPPVPVLRRLGFRTLREIDEERFALKALRGDFHDTPAAGARTRSALEALEAARA